MALIAAPVSARNTHQLEGTDLPRVLDMRAATEIKEVALLVNAHLGVGQIFDNLYLIVLPFVAKVLQSLLAGPAVAQEGILLADNPPHAGLYLWQIIRSERAREIEIVVKAIFDSGPDGEASVRKDLLHGLCHDVRSGMAHALNRRIIDRFLQFYFYRH